MTMIPTSTAAQGSKSNKFSLASILGLLCVVLGTLILADWHSAIYQNRRGQPNQHSLDGGRRSLEALAPVGSIIDDDNVKDATCRKYLLNFLNGTTDSRDECDGLKSAYDAADCEDTNAIIPFMRSDNNDALIDDAFESWQCCGSIFEYYASHCRRPELASFKLFGVVTVLVLCGLVMSLTKTYKVEWIPDAAACILVGTTVGGLVRFFYPSLIKDNLSFDNDLFLHILLPPIIFQAALNIDKRAFRRDLFPILFFAIFGTVLSAVIIGIMTHFLTGLGGGTSLSLFDSLLFGSLIASIDPVATLGILQSVGVSQTDTLYTLIFGESLLNDGVAIVLFDALAKHLADDTKVDQAMLVEILIAFLKVTAASIGIGVACGALCTVYFWALKRKHTAVVETALFFCFALMPFYIADGLGNSGIISIMTMGFMCDYFIIGGAMSDEAQWMAFMERQDESVLRAPDGQTKWWHAYRAFAGTGHLSSRSKHHVGFVAHVIASLMEMAIFAYLGIFLFNDKNILNIRLNLTGIVGCIVSRGFMVFAFSNIINFFVFFDVERRIGSIFRADPLRYASQESDDTEFITTTSRIDRRTQQILLLAGVRGAVSFALVENIPVYDAVRKSGSHFKPELKAMTSSAILFTVFVFGALTYFLLQQDGQRDPNHAMLSHRLLGDDQLDSGDEEEENDRLTDLELRADFVPPTPVS